MRGSGSTWRRRSDSWEWLRATASLAWWSTGCAHREIKEIDYDDDLVELAEANGSGWHEALDLCSAVVYGVEILYAGPRKARLMKPLED